jgi:hypothetical protein
MTAAPLLKQTGRKPVNPIPQVPQLTVEKLATFASPGKPSNWQPKTVNKTELFPWTRKGAAFPAIALSEMITDAPRKKSPYRSA